jgi:hypothetical protein
MRVFVASLVVLAALALPAPAGELDRESPVIKAIPALVQPADLPGGTEMDRETPDQSWKRWRGGWGWGGWGWRGGWGWGGWHRPWYGGWGGWGWGGYGSWYRPWYGGWGGWGWGGWYRPVVSIGWGWGYPAYYGGWGWNGGWSNGWCW